MENIWISLSSLFIISVLITTIHSQSIIKQSNILENVKSSNNLISEKLNNNNQFKEFITINDNINKNNIEMDNINIKESTDKSSHKRVKRLIWITDDGRLALPPGTVLSISPTISLPLVRYPPDGFLSNLTMSFPLTIDFDKLGLTDNQNPLGVLPPVFARSMGRAAGSLLANYIGDYLQSRKIRSSSGGGGGTSSFDQYNNIDFDQKSNKFDKIKLPENHRNVFHGGERAILYGVIEDLISTFGYNGKACLLRVICEVHSKKLHQFGLFGEIIKLFFTATKSQFAELLPEYVSAEQMGEGKIGPGECFPYYKECTLSIFKTTKNYYREHSSVDDDEHLEKENSNVIDVTNLENDPSINDIDGHHLNM